MVGMGARRSLVAVHGSWILLRGCLALVVCSWGCEGESGDGPAATGGSSGMPAGGATGGSAEPASGGEGGQDPACECDSFVCGATLTEPKIDVPPECGSINTSRWLAGD